MNSLCSSSLPLSLFVYDVCAHVCVMLMFWIGTLLWVQRNSLTFFGNMHICFRVEKMDTTRMFVRLICSWSQQPVSLAPAIRTRGKQLAWLCSKGGKFNSEAQYVTFYTYLAWQLGPAVK